MARKKNPIEAAEFFFATGIHLDSRLLYIGPNGNSENGDTIDAYTAGSVLKALHLMKVSVPVDEEITIILNSYGGDVDQGFAIYDFLSSMPQPLHIKVYGACHSMAAAILQAGNRRSMATHSSMLIHDGSTIIEGYNRSTVKSWLNHSQTTDRWYEDILFDRMRAKDGNFSRKNLQRWLSHDTILLPERALELGLIDDIVEG